MKLGRAEWGVSGLYVFGKFLHLVDFFSNFSINILFYHKPLDYAKGKKNIFWFLKASLVINSSIFFSNTSVLYSQVVSYYQMFSNSFLLLNVMSMTDISTDVRLSEIKVR